MTEISMQTLSRDDLGKAFASALSRTEAALARSYCPCSGLCVAAGWVLPGDQLVTGINYESASYGLTLCAERAALVRAQVEGVIERGTGMVLTARWQDGKAGSGPLMPCGACRQWLAELSQRLERDFPVYSFWQGSSTGVQCSARALMPASFDLKDLSQDEQSP